MKKNSPGKLLSEIVAITMFPFFITVFIALLCFWDIILRFAPNKFQSQAVRYFNYSIYSCLKLIGTSYKVEGAIPALWDQPCIIVSNHQSMFDMPWLYTVFNKFNPRYVAKIELSKRIPGISICLREGGSALIDRKNAGQAISQIQSLASRMKEQKFSTVIFPEGTRARNGELKKFKETGLRELIKNLGDTTLIPVTIDNSWILMTRKFGPVPAFCRLKMRIGEPIKIQQGGDVDAGIKKSFEIIHEQLEEMRLE